MTPGRRVGQLLWVCATIAAMSACGGARLRHRGEAIEQVIQAARERGAKECAPVELALAEAHSDFGAVELGEGDYYRAKQEFSVAERNAHEAVRKVNEGHCGTTVVEAPVPGDRDGDGLADTIDDCPTKAEDKDGFEDQDGCPETDNDQDGIADRVDDCPDDAEDQDGFEDQDGCPDLDNDGDGLADAIDKCPDEPEDKDGVLDDDGCPDCDDDGDGVPECPQAQDKCPGQAGSGPDGCPPKYKNVVVTKDRIELKQTVFFATGKAKIKRESFALLDEVALALKDHPGIRVRIEGHTDSQGKEVANRRLSAARAAAVKTYLRGQGVEGSRMISEGYGESRPIADNRTAAGRAQNRRVEFVIVDR